MSLISDSKTVRFERGFWALWLNSAWLLVAFLVPTAGPMGSDDLSVVLSPTKVEDGRLVRVHIQVPEGVEASLDARGRYDGVDFRFFGSYGLFAVPFNSSPGSREVEISYEWKGRRRTTRLSFEVVAGKYKEETLPVDPKFVQLSDESIARIQADAEKVKNAYASSSPEKLWGRGFRLPIKSQITSRFGNKRMFNGEMKSFHSGLDLRAPTGRAVKSAAQGRVVLSEDLFFTGNTVILDHGLGLFTLYAHLSEIKVKNGQEVRSGQLIGLAGSTGRSSGPHLHWGAVVNGVKFDPLDLLKVVP